MKNKTVKAKHVYELALTVTVTAAGVNAAREEADIWLRKKN
jgi:hypothetical protein